MRTAPSGRRPRCRPTRRRSAIVRWLQERYASSDWTLLTSLKPSRWQPNDGWKTGRARLSSLRRGFAAAAAPLQPSLGRRRARGHTRAAHRPRRGRLHVLARLCAERRVDALRPRRLQEHHLPAAQRAPAGDRALRPQVRRLSLHLGRRVPDQELAVRCSGRRRLRLLRLRLLRHEDALRLPDHGERARRPRHGRARQAAHHAQAAAVRRPHLLRAQGAEVGRGVHLPRRPVSRGRLVHPLDGLHGRRHAVVARQLELLQEQLRLGPTRAQALRVAAGRFSRRRHRRPRPRRPSRRRNCRHSSSERHRGTLPS